PSLGRSRRARKNAHRRCERRRAVRRRSVNVLPVGIRKRLEKDGAQRGEDRRRGAAGGGETRTGVCSGRVDSTTARRGRNCIGGEGSAGERARAIAISRYRSVRQP